MSQVQPQDGNRKRKRGENDEGTAAKKVKITASPPDHVNHLLGDVGVRPGFSGQLAAISPIPEAEPGRVEAQKLSTHGIAAHGGVPSGSSTMAQARLYDPTSPPMPGQVTSGTTAETPKAEAPHRYNLRKNTKKRSHSY